MIITPTYKDKNIGVFGLARTGLASVDALVASGANVFAWDDNPSGVNALNITGTNLYGMELERLDALLLAPGVPYTHPEPHAIVKRAHAAKAKIISDFDVFEAARETLPSHTCVAITGTNGKSTTTALIDHMIRAAGRESAMGGNIGTGVLALDPLSKGGVYVFEMSSFQLDITRDFAPDIAVFLNITPDHLDRHGDMAGYMKAKARLFALQDKHAVAVIGVDEEAGVASFQQYEDRAIAVSVTRHLEEGVSVLNGKLYDSRAGAEPLMDISECLSLLGEHNHQNAAAAYAVGTALNIAPTMIFDAFKNFPGLEHRQEIVRTLDGVRYVNDSKATNVDAAARALDAFRNIRWIAGGRAKGQIEAEIADHMTGVKRAYLVGESAAAIASKISGKADYVICVDINEAVDQACKDAMAGDVVLLSPACTALDQFPDFIERGNAFKQAVAGLSVQSMRGPL